MRIADAATLAAVGAVVLLVSLPRLKEFALRENELDARALVVRLGRLLERNVEAAERPTVEHLVSGDRTLARQLDDVEFLDGGRLLRRHGYLFEVPDAGAAQQGGASVRAWPWSHRKTGFSAFAWRAEQGLLGSPNRDGYWSGPGSPPSLDAGDWRELDEP